MVEIKIILSERCVTRVNLQDMNVLPRKGVPNVCATCPANLPPEKCRAIHDAITFYEGKRKDDWKEGDESIAT